MSISLSRIFIGLVMLVSNISLYVTCQLCYFLVQIKLKLTVRYGNTAPRTPYGKIATMLYAVLGIPVYILYFRNIGKAGGKIYHIARLIFLLKVFANVLKWIYRNIYNWTVRRKNAVRYRVMEKEVDGQAIEEEEVNVDSFSQLSKDIFARCWSHPLPVSLWWWYIWL